MTSVIYGTHLADKMIADLKARVESLNSKNIYPQLSLIQVGHNEAVDTYVKAKIKRGARIGIKVTHTLLKEDTSYTELRSVIAENAKNVQINGIMVENPLPKGLDFFKVVENIPYYKDVDGMTATSQGMIALRNEFLTPATAAAVVALLDDMNLPRGTTVTIINRSPVVGKPLAMMLLNRDFTVTVCHSKTADIRGLSRISDVLVTAVGTLNFIDRSFVSENSIVIDVGINPVENGIKGDAKYDDLFGYVKAITPVPGGVGPLTATLIMQNVVRAAEYQALHMKNDSE